MIKSFQKLCFSEKNISYLRNQSNCLMMSNKMGVPRLSLFFSLFDFSEGNTFAWFKKSDNTMQFITVLLLFLGFPLPDFVY